MISSSSYKIYSKEISKINNPIWEGEIKNDIKLCMRIENIDKFINFHGNLNNLWLLNDNEVYPKR
jgi:hypothetical protein